MDRSEQAQQQHQQVIGATGQMAYAIPPFKGGPVVVTGTPAVPVSSPTQPLPISNSQHQLPYHQVQHLHNQQQQHQQQQQLQAFWDKQMQEVEQTTDFKNHSLPLARIKKIMKADEDVKMISAEAPVVFAKACEMFILELTLRSWIHTEENKRRTLQKNDIAAAISRTDVFDFLVDIIPRDELKEEGLGVTKAMIPLGSPADSVPYYYVAQQHSVGPTGMVMGNSVDQTPVYAGRQPRPAQPFMPWDQPQQQQNQQQQSGNLWARKD